MWCTRWYLPLVLLPLPIAPPYFLVLFLFSTTIHAKPCFYCIVLLTAMFLSSCYWPPVPLDTPLSTPWSQNITTFSDALFFVMPNLPAELVPSDIPIADHCWCDFTSGAFFEPFSMKQWELDSVERLKEEMERKIRDAGKQNEGLADRSVPSEPVTSTNLSGVMPSPVSKWASVWGTVWSFSRTPDASSGLSTPPPVPEYELRPPPAVEENNSTKAPAMPSRLPLLRREYDLRPYGFDVVMDFGWSRVESI